MNVDLGGAIYALGWSLVHFLWQGALIALALELALVALRKSSADLRYAVRCGAMLLMGLAPVVTFLTLLPTQPAQAAPAPMVTLAEAATTPASAWSGVTWLAVVVAVWSLGAGLLGARLLRDYLRIRRLQKSATGAPLPTYWQVRFDDMASAMGVRAIARVVDSALLTAPTVIGCLKPVVLVPARVLTGLSADQIEALIAHELAHVRRHDFVINLVQSALEALLFYHPAVWWVSKGIRAEREYCCDDMALRATDEMSYARALTTLESWRGAEPQIGMSTLGGSLMLRIQRLLGIRPSGPVSRGPLMALGVLLVASTLGATAFGYATPQDPEEVLNELRAEIAELRAQIDDLKDMLHDFHNVHRTMGRHHDDDGGHDFHFGLHDGGSGHSERHRHDDDHDHGDRHDHVNLHTMPDHVRDVLKDAGVRIQGHGDDFDISIEGDKLHDHIRRAMESDHVHEALEDAGVEWIDEGDNRFSIRIDGDRLHGHIQKALKSHGLDGHGKRHVIEIDDDDFHGDVDVHDLHGRIQKALKESGIHSRHGNTVIDLDGDLDLGSIHEHVQKALKEAGIHDRHHNKVIELHGDVDLGEIHEHVRKALEDSGIHKMRVDLDGLHELHDLKDLHELHRLEDLHQLKELDNLHETIQKALETSGVHGLRGRILDADGIELDGDFRVEVRTMRDGGGADSDVRTLKLRKRDGQPVHIEINGVEVDPEDLEDADAIFLRKLDRDDDEDLMEKIRKARKEAEAKERHRKSAL